MKFRYLPFLLILSSLIVPFVYASPVTFEQYPFTVSITGWKINADYSGGVVDGYVQQDLPFTIRILSANGQVASMDGSVLGTGSVVSAFLPIDLLPNTQILVEADLFSNYTPAQVVAMNLQSAQVTATVQYCIPLGNWWCLGPFTYNYQTTVTRDQVIAAYQQNST